MVALFRVLACLLALAAQAGFVQGARPAESDLRATRVAQLLAGVPPVPGDPEIDRLAATPAWAAHRAEMQQQWEPVRERLRVIERWRRAELGEAAGRGGTLLYPFSGPDFLNANAFFPGQARYLMFGLERPGELPSLGGGREDAFVRLLATVREAMQDLFERNYFITSYMTRQLNSPYKRGTVPVMAIMMALTGHHIVRIEPLDLFPDLTAAYGEPDRRIQVNRPRLRMFGARILFRHAANGPLQQVDYLSFDATDRALRWYPDFLPWLAAQQPSAIFLKSASYLLHDQQFAGLRQTLLESTATLIVQDDTGVPFRHLQQGGWQLRFFGEYRAPIPALRYGHQPDLKAAWKSIQVTPRLPFPFGYHWKDGESGLIVATRAMQPAGAPSRPAAGPRPAGLTPPAGR